MNENRPAERARTLQATIIRSWNACTVIVALNENGHSQQLVAKEVASHAAAEVVARTFAATHGVPWDKVEVVSR